MRRVEAPTRANTPLVTYDEKLGLVKINPLAAWSDEDMEAYIAEHDVLVNPLVAEGYPSIGCAPCTAKPLPGADPRSGRWAGHREDRMRAARHDRRPPSTPSTRSRPRRSTSSARSRASSTGR